MSGMAWRWPQPARTLPTDRMAASASTQPVRLILQVLRPAALALLAVVALFLFGVSRYLHSVEVRRTEAFAQHAVAMWQHLREQQLGQLRLLSTNLTSDPLIARPCVRPMSPACRP